MTIPRATRVLLDNLLIAILPALVLMIMPCSAALAADSGELRFTILHTNDFHAHDEPFIERGRSVGGMPRIIHIIRSIRANDPNVLVIDAGDIFQGTSFFKFYHGATEVEMLNRAGYDLYTIGNHEFDDGPDNLATQLKNAKFTVLNANIDASAKPELQALIKPSVVKTIKGQRVGFIGGIVPDLTEVSLRTEGVKIKNAGAEWMKPINDEIAKLKSEGVDKIILVTHIGVEGDRELAKNPDVDVIVGGHSHTRLSQAIVVPHADGSKAMIVQAGCYGRALGKLDLAFDAKGNLELPNTQYRLIDINEKTPSEPDITAYLKEKAIPFAELRNTIDGIADGDFDNSFRHYPGDSPLGDLITDALAEAGKDKGVTIAMQNRGGIRARIDRGIITQEKVEEVLPFENRLVFATVPGDELLKALENSVSGALGAKFLDVHGIKFGYNADKPAGERIVFAEAQDTDGKWGKVEAQKHYRIAINDYSFKHGEGYDFSKATDVVETNQRLSVFLQQWLLKNKHVKPRVQGRIIPLGAHAKRKKSSR
jgi:5'-nucleotidase/UDP-sugar diphosphatase